MQRGNDVLEKENKDLRKSLIKAEIMDTDVARGALMPEGLANTLAEEFMVEYDSTGGLVVKSKTGHVSNKNPAKDATVEEAVFQLTGVNGKYRENYISLNHSQAGNIQNKKVKPSNQSKLKRLKALYLEAKEEGGSPQKTIALKNAIANLGASISSI